MSKESFFPLSNKLLVKQLPKDEKTAGGLYKAANVAEPLKGIVVEVGRGIPLINSDNTGFVIIPLECEVGDTVIFPPDVALEMDVDGEKLLLMVEDQILMRQPAKKLS